MQFSTAGIILITTRYAECVAFYAEILRLPLLFALERADSTLTCFDLGGNYLMIEPGREPATGSETRPHMKLRFNVSDLTNAASVLRDRGIKVRVRHHAWGSTAEFTDPDGNPCALRSEHGFGV